MRWLLVLAIVAVSFTRAAAQSPFSGRVISSADGAPLAGVELRAEYRGLQRAAATSDQEGRFRIDAVAVFATRVKPGEPVMLSVAKPGFVGASKLVRIGDTTEIRIELAAASDTALDLAERAKLEALLRAGARGALFLVPYQLPAGAGGLASDQLSERLRANLERAIVTHVQSSGLISTGGRMALVMLPIEPGKDAARLKMYGAQLSALAVISGFGALEEVGGRSQVVMSSTYVVVPQVPSLDSPIIYVDDVLPPEQLGSPRLWERLSKLWGRSTVVALGMREFREAQASGDRERLQKIRAYLVGERASAGPGNEQFLVQLNALIALVDKELAR
jgi:hypothetical protein